MKIRRRQTLAWMSGSVAAAWMGGGIRRAYSQGSSFKGLNVGTELSWTQWRDQLLPLYQKANVRWLRVWYNWSSIEPQAGQYEADTIAADLKLARKQGFRILFVIWGTPAHAGSGALGAIPDPAALKRYCQWIRSNLGSVVDAWEVGNEPNLEKYFDGSLEDYVNTLKVAYGVLQGDAPVIAAGCSGASRKPDWQRLLASGLEDACDRVNLHPYRKKTTEVIAMVDDFLALVKKPLWITELGYPGGDSTDPDAAAQEIKKADFLTELYPQLLGRTEKLFWYRGIQGEKLHPLRYGLVECDKITGSVTPLPAYRAFAQQS